MSLQPRKVAIIGAGISGLTAAWLLQNNAEPLDSGAPAFVFTVFDSADRIGGHTATVDVIEDSSVLAIDTGFIVYNDWTYPQFIRLLERLGVTSQATDMSFSVQCADSGLAYSGRNLDTLFTQRRNLLRPSYLKMLRDIVRFNRQAVEDMHGQRIDASMTLGGYLKVQGYSGLFVSHYLAPMCAAIWSVSTRTALDLPMLFFVRFFANHGLLSINDRPQWRVISGGSRQYLEPLSQGFADSIRLSARIRSVRRSHCGVQLLMGNGQVEYFDEVIFACHSDQALALLDDPSRDELSVLRAIPYQESEVVLHTDTRLLPARQKAWAAWNYRLDRQRQEAAVVTYNMNILQRFTSKHTYCVTLNACDQIDPARIIGRYSYAHPSFSLSAVDAQSAWESVNGINRTWFCGAYWGNGFHEDGVVSARRVVQAMQAAPASQIPVANSSEVAVA